MSSAQLLGFLASAFTEPTRDPLWGNIFLSPGLERIASSVPFSKLGRIKQLGPAFLVYPGATHTRRAHSLGVFHMARRLVQALQSKVGGIDVKEIDVSKDFTTADKYDIQSTPTTIVLDRSGQIVQSFVGLPSQSNLMAAMETAKSR